VAATASVYYSSPDPAPGLGMVDKIGISVGVVGGVAVVAALLWYSTFRRRRALSHNDGITGGIDHAVGLNMGYAETDSAETGLYEAASPQREHVGSELDGSTAFYELPGRSQAHDVAEEDNFG